MAHVQQLFDHMNDHFRRVYKDGVWIKTYLTKIGKNSKGVVFFECIDAKKFAQNKPSARIVMRLMDNQLQSYRMLLQSNNISPDFSENIEFSPGSFYIAFKILPSMHFERGMMPMVREINASDQRVSSENLLSGFRIGIENTQLGVPINNKKPWIEQDNQILYDYVVNRKLSIESVSLKLERTPLACLEQIDKMKLIPKSQLSVMREDVNRLRALSENL